MPKKDKENALESQYRAKLEGNEELNGLIQQRKMLQCTMREKDAALEHSLTQNVNALRQEERQKRLNLYGETEKKKQAITSALMLEFKKICEETEVPPYIKAIAKILDNYQGNIF